MSINLLLTVNSVLVLVFGIGFVLLPETLLSIYGIELSPIGTAIAQLLGAAFIGVGIFRWQARTSNDSRYLKAVVLSGFVEDTIGFFILLKAQLAGLANASGWSNVFLYGIFAIGFGYFWFQRND